MENEIWKDILGHEGDYQISNKGRVKSLSRKLFIGGDFTRTTNERILAQNIINSGYFIVSMCSNNRRFTYLVHRLVAIAFLPNPKEQVNHIDENKLNNNLNNLEWVTRKENVNHGTCIERSVLKNSFPVIQYSLKGDFVKRWNSLSEIKRVTGMHKGNIGKCCNGLRKTAYKNIWKFENRIINNQ